MAWWAQPLARLLGRPASGPGTRTAAAPVSRPSAGGWNDVPRLQRVLAEPIAPVAINDRFRDSLAAFANPSLLAPLSHRVDAGVGGLVDGLVTPGEPGGGYRAPELAVPQAAASTAPAVQRRAGSASPAWQPADTDLAVVPMEYPEASTPPPTLVEAPADEVLLTHGEHLAADGPDAAGQPVAEGAGPQRPVPTDLPVVAPTPAVQRSVAGSPSATVQPSEAGPPSATGQPSEAAAARAIEAGVRSLPVQRSSADRSVHGAGSAPAAVQRTAVTAPQQPTGSVEATAQREPADPDRPASAEPPAVLQRTLPVVSAPGRPASAAVTLTPSTERPTVDVQRSAEVGYTEVPLVLAPNGALDGETFGRSAVSPVERGDAPLLSGAPSVTPAGSGERHASRIPVDLPVSRTAASERPSDAWDAGAPGLSPAATPTDGSLVGAAPSGSSLPDLTVSRSVMSTGPIGRVDGGTSEASRSAAPAGDRLVGAAPGGMLPPELSVGGESSVSREVSASPALTVSRSAVSSGVSTVSASGRADAGTRVVSPFAAPALDRLVDAAPPGMSSPVELMVSRSAASSGASTVSASGRVDAATSSLFPHTTPPTMTHAEAPIIAVQRRSAAVHPLSVPVSSPVQSSQPPLALVRQPSSRTPEAGPRPGEGMSFASMFAGFTGESVPAEAGFGTVQRDVGGDASAPPAPAAAEPAPAETTPSTPAAAAPAPAAAPAATNVDELARRLYEPLAARLREELWLDRERAGWLTDLRGG